MITDSPTLATGHDCREHPKHGAKGTPGPRDFCRAVSCLPIRWTPVATTVSYQLQSPGKVHPMSRSPSRYPGGVRNHKKLDSMTTNE